MSELLLAGQTNDEILQSLSYKLAPTSEYIQQRRMSRFYPSGASSYSSNTTQIARIELKGQGGFLDLSTLKIAYRLVNNSATAPLVLAGGPHALVSRIRVFCQGALVEDCSHYNRVHDLFTELMSPANWKINAACETNIRFYDPTSAGDNTGVSAIDVNMLLFFLPRARSASCIAESYGQSKWLRSAWKSHSLHQPTL